MVKSLKITKKQIEKAEAVPLKLICKFLNLKIGNPQRHRKKTGKVKDFLNCYNSKGHKNADRSPSMLLNHRANRFRCLVCPGLTGGAIELLMNHSRPMKTYEEAVIILGLLTC